MQDDVRVTVVATGLNRADASRARPPIQLVEPAIERPRPVLLRTGTGNEVVDYAQRERGPQTGADAAAAGKSDPGFDYLDIPAFLRRQAD